MADITYSVSAQYIQESMRECIKHAVRCLTTKRHTSVCVKRDHVAGVWQQLLDSGEANKYFTDQEREEIKTQIDQWELLHDSKVQTKRASDLRVCYLGGDNPINAIEVLVANGILCQNVWAIEKNSKTLKKAWNATKNSRLRNVKVFKGDILSFWKHDKEPFDIIYFDARGSLPAAKQNTLKVVGYVFLYNKLTSPGALITNFSFPPREANSASSQHVYIDKEREMINFLVKEYMKYRLCNVLRKDSSPENNAEYLSKRTDEDNYGDYVSYQVIDSAHLFIPAQRMLSSERKSLWGQIFNEKKHFLKEINSYSSVNVEGTTKGTNENSTKTTRNQELMAVLKKLEVDDKVHARKNLFSTLKRMAETFLEKSNNSCCEAWVDEILPDWKSEPSLQKEKIPSLLLTSLLFSSPFHFIRFCKDDFVAKCLVPLFKADVDERFPSCCDVATLEQATCLLAGLVYGQMAYPSFPVMDKLFRLSYTAEKRLMFADVFVFDKCRYLYDQLPSVDCVCFAEPKQQIVFGMGVDGLCKHLAGICSEDLFKFCHVASKDVIMEGEVSFPNSERSIPERQKIEDILLKEKQTQASNESPWVVTSAGKLHYDAIFKQADKDQDGLVSGEEVKNTFMASSKDQLIFAHIWDLCDITNRGQLNSDEFALAMYLVNQKVMGVDPPQMLSPEMVPPSMRASSAGCPVEAGEAMSSLPRCISMDSDSSDLCEGLNTLFVQAKHQGNEEDSDEMIGIERGNPLFSEEVALDQGTGMIGTATAADDEEVLIATFGEKVYGDTPGREKRKRWTYAENVKVMECYYKSKLSRDRGYMQRMLDLWNEEGMFGLSKGRLAGQAQSILKRKLLSEDVLKEIRERVGFQEEEERQARQDRCVIC